MHEAERFLSVKQDLYSRYIHLANKFILYADSVRKGDDTAEAVPDYDELSRLRWNILLLAPQSVQVLVEESYDRVYSAFHAAKKSSSIPGLRKTISNARSARQEVTEAMRADLLDNEELILPRQTGEPAENHLPSDPSRGS